MDTYWLDVARKLPYGAKRKIDCCGTSPTAYVSQDAKGARFGPCFRCGRREYEAHGPRTLAEIMVLRKQEQAFAAKRAMPDSCISLADGPVEAQLFVLQAFITPEWATTHLGFKYDPESDRVLMPITGGFLARAIRSWQKPKYIKAAPDSTEMFALHRSVKACAVVEDILSACRIYEAGTSSTAVLGTSIGKTTAAHLGSYDVLLAWFDPDKAGEAARKRLRKAMRLYDVQIINIRSDVDPKRLHRGKIKELIEGALSNA